MRRPVFACLFALAFAGTALSGPTLEELEKDASKKKEIDKGKKALDKYFKAESDQTKVSSRAALANAQQEFLDWLAATQSTMGMDLRAQPDVVIQLIDQRRLPYLETKLKKGSIEYVKVGDAKGMERHEYAILVPKAYEPAKRRIPVVVSLHGRVINPRHPAFRNASFNERAREVVWNNWFNSPAAEQVLVIAPTTEPNGFQFQENHADDLQALYRTLGEALTQYRGDWDRVFLEVHGQAMRVACEQALVFAGVIVRDRADDRKAPFLAPEHHFLLENLNGVPLCYIADAANWNLVGKPMSDALTAAYAKAGKPENLVVIQATRDVDGALRGGEEQIKEFVQTHARPKSHDKFTWRFFEAQQNSPVPLVIDGNYMYDVSDEAKKAPLAAKCGRIAFEARRDNVEGQEVNRIDLQITEAQGLVVSLMEPMVNFDLPVMITVNGETVLKPKKLERDWGFFFEWMLGRRFFMLPCLGQESVTFPLKPEFASPEETKPPEGAGDGEAKPAEGTPAGSTPSDGAKEEGR